MLQCSREGGWVLSDCAFLPLPLPPLFTPRRGGLWDAPLEKAPTDSCLPSPPPQKKQVRLWDARSGRAEMTRTGHAEAIMDMAMAPDGRSVVTGGDDGVVRVFSMDGPLQQ